MDQYSILISLCPDSLLMSYSSPQSPSAEVISYLVHACHLFHRPAFANSQ